MQYGNVGVTRDGRCRTEPAHRVAYELTYGPIPAGLLVCHHCDTPLCVRPDHLFLGTHLDNKADQMHKNRQASVKGDRNPRVIIRDAECIRIRDRYRAGGISTRQLACEYGVTHRTIIVAMRRADALTALAANG